MTPGLDLDEELAAELARVALVIGHRTGDLVVPEPPARSPIARVARQFGLTTFERWALTLAIAAELDAHVACRLARRDDNYGAAWPCVGVAIATFGAGSALAPALALSRTAPLRAWALVELDGAGPRPARPMRLGPGVIDTLVHRAGGDEAPITLDELDLPGALADQCARAAAQLADAVLITVVGHPGSGRTAVARAVIRAAGEVPLVRQVATPEAVRYALRDARWTGRIAVAADVELAQVEPVAAIASQLARPMVLVGSSPLAPRLAELGIERVVELAVDRPARARRSRIWSRAIPAAERDPALDLAAIAGQFRLGASQIVAAARLARSMTGGLRVAPVHAAAACRAVSTSALAELARPLETDRTLDDLIVPSAVRRELELAIAWARHGVTVFADDGAGRALARGPGMACLFYGPSGTGKTLAAQVLAGAIGLAIYRVDLSQVMDKYIGETEKRLERLFTEADRGNAVLFFDEADVLFARRTEVNDARDRYANLETGYLLQRIEYHPGIVILATNLRDNLDPAFLRRLHVVAELPVPRPPERAAIWRRLLPEVQARDVDIDWLAQRFTMTGGEINNAIATSLLLAAAEARTVAMADLVFGVWRELTKSGRLIEAGQFGPWADRVIAFVQEAR